MLCDDLAELSSNLRQLVKPLVAQAHLRPHSSAVSAALNCSLAVSKICCHAFCRLIDQLFERLDAVAGKLFKISPRKVF